MSQPFAWLTFYFFTIWVLTTQWVPTRLEQIIITYLDVHFCNFNCTWSMVWDIEFNVERTQLFELQLVNYLSCFICQRTIKCLCHLPFDISKFPNDLSFASVKFGYSIFHLQWVNSWSRLNNITFTS